MQNKVVMILVDGMRPDGMMVLAQKSHRAVSANCRANSLPHCMSPSGRIPSTSIITTLFCMGAS